MTNYISIGRTWIRDNALRLAWTGSGFSINFYGTGTAAVISSSTDNPIYLGYLNVYVDSAALPVSTVKIDRKGLCLYTLADRLPPGAHTLTVKKRNEAAYGGSATLGIHDISVIDGCPLEPPPAPERLIEFVGDSITSGFGNMVSDPGELDYATDTCDGTRTYAMLAADALGAAASVLSRSGIRFCREPGKAASESMINHYTKISNLTGNADPWNFARPADAVVVNLGTNDNGTAGDFTFFTSEAAVLLSMIRANNPGALIVWCYGIMGEAPRISGPIKAAVTDMTAAGDDKVFYLSMKPIDPAREGLGVHGHPTVFTHIKNSFVLAEFLAEKMRTV
ncbi:MAG: GDSL-type esterase/lipase family protein [Oscillospiraceae bacterium]|nr:GDSL-type esterase/lipase family protein [Oscillospiraceae bacterium]